MSVEPIATFAAMIAANVFAETVAEIEHSTDRLVCFRMTRPASFRFRSGEFVKPTATVARRGARSH